MFSNVSRINHSSAMNNTVKNKIKYFPQILTVGPQITLKQKWHYFLSWLTITTKIDIYVYKFWDDYICEDLL